MPHNKEKEEAEKKKKKKEKEKKATKRLSLLASTVTRGKEDKG